MVFNTCGKSLNNYLFRYGADELETVKSYKYLGLIIIITIIIKFLYSAAT